ncbi:MAG: hypothetical protein KIS96_12055 [Bauldia sp.]|nr:hypothetical protein [Bauldia sp.]
MRIAGYAALLIGVVAAMSAVPVAAAELAPARSAFCALGIDGPLEPGDAARLAAELADADRLTLAQSPELPDNVFFDVTPRRDLTLCLSGTGGSDVEGLLLFQAIIDQGWATYVDADAACVGACALAFMGGTLLSLQDSALARSIHPDARLGFTVPSLNLPGGAYEADEIETRAAELWRLYAAATAQMNAAVYRHPRPYLPPQLFAEAAQLEGEPLYLDTVGELIRFNVALEPFARFEPDEDPRAFLNVCNNLLGRAFGIAAKESSGPYETAFDADEVQPRLWVMEDGTVAAGVGILRTSFLDTTQTRCHIGAAATYTTEMFALSTTADIAREDALFLFAPETPIADIGTTAHDGSRTPFFPYPGYEVVSYWVTDGLVFALLEDGDRAALTFVAASPDAYNYDYDEGAILFEGMRRADGAFRGDAFIQSIQCLPVAYPAELAFATNDPSTLRLGDLTPDGATCVGYPGRPPTSFVFARTDRP